MTCKTSNQDVSDYQQHRGNFTEYAERHRACAQVEFGYPFVASTVPELEEMLGRLINSAALRQAASRILLDMAKYLSVRTRLRSGLCLRDGCAACARSFQVQLATVEARCLQTQPALCTASCGLALPCYRPACRLLLCWSRHLPMPARS